MVSGVDRWFRPGQDRWVAMQYYFEKGWSVDGSWTTLLGMTPTTTGGGGGTVQLDGGNSRLLFKGNNNVWGSTAGNLFDGAGPLSGSGYRLNTGKWIKLTWHVKFSADPSVGFVEVFGDLADGQGMRRLAPLRTRATLKYLNGTPSPAHLRVGIYRDPSLTATARMYVDGITVATTRAGAETNAFAAA